MREPVRNRNIGPRLEPNFDDVFKPARRKRKPARESVMTRISARGATDLIAIAVAFVAVVWVFVNALGLQKVSNTARIAPPVQKTAVPLAVPVTAPLPQPRPDPTSGRSRTDLLRDVQQELASRGYYDGAIDGAAGPRISQAIRDFELTQRLKVTGEVNEGLLAQIRKAGPKSDVTGSVKPANAIAGNADTLSVQRWLARYGYGPVRATGTNDRETRDAIARFERDRNMPETGEVSDRLRRELASFSGGALD